MWHQVFVPAPVLLIPIMVITTKCHTPKNNSDVIVTYSNHAEVSENRPALVSKPTTSISAPAMSYHSETADKGTTERYSDEVIKDDVFFVPNEKELIRNEDYLEHEAMSFDDVMNRKTVSDVLLDKNVRVDTEAPTGDIIFVSGKNNENSDKPDQANKKKGTHNENTHRTRETPSISQQKLNCSNLNCQNNIKSICGGKIDGRLFKYRLFLNECYFRKVNCNFKQAINRYKEVPMEKCRNVALHMSERPFVFKRTQYADVQPVKSNNSRRSFSSRRALTMSIDGQFCTHPCPVACPNDYEPECAVSHTGRHRVFVNHCSLDLNSCSFGVVWKLRPLSECVGGKKADMRQNRGFIGWMQRVGIVDRKGRLVLS